MVKKIHDISEIKQEDLDTINAIAQRYGIDTQTLGKILMGGVKKLIRKQIRVSEEEYEAICRNAHQMKLTVPDWCAKAALLGLATIPKDEPERSLFLNELRYGAGWGREGRSKKLDANFKNRENVNALVDFVEKEGIPLSVFIRHFAVKLSLT